MFKQSPMRGAPRARPKTLILLALFIFLFYISFTPYVRDRTNVAIWRHDQTATQPEKSTNNLGVEPVEPLKPADSKPPSQINLEQDDGVKKPEDSQTQEEKGRLNQSQDQQVQDAADRETENKRKQEEEKKKKEKEAAEAMKKTQEEKKKQEEKAKQEEKKKKEDEEARSRHEQMLRDEFAREYESAKQLPSSNAIYGNTLNSLSETENRPEEHSSRFRASSAEELAYAKQRPVHFNPYPDYNSLEWNRTHDAPYVPCVGANGDFVEDLLVFKGHPAGFPKPSFGGFDILGMDGDVCYERETRLGPYGYSLQLNSKTGLPVNWDNISWGDLQRKCSDQNAARFGKGVPNEYILTAYKDIAEEYGNEKRMGKRLDSEPDEVKRQVGNGGAAKPESRTAILLRTYTGKKYTENDKQVIRSLVSELSLRSGGEYEVFLLLHARDDSIDLRDRAAYQGILDAHIPKEFHGITKVWNDQAVWDVYEALTDGEEKTVHHAQWLSVQKFSQDHPEYDFVWNWEMDVRIVGHNYDFLRRLEGFAKKQPRKGLWERNDRYYIPDYHGKYDSEFRAHTDQRTRGSQVWGPPALPFIHPVGPRPPVQNPDDDAYEWGVGEEADLITLGPIVDPVNSSWIFADKVWGYKDGQNLPRRTTIVTQSRISKRLLDIMHVENLRGNHIASEMTPQTVALLHGLKAVYAPHPQWFDRPWSGTFLAKWFNSGPKGSSGGEGSPIGYGRERRYQGTTWYYRAEPPSRLYNNWMGYIDTDIGGRTWEIEHGRPCLPPMILHPIKEVEPTEPGFATRFELNYG